MSVNEKKVDELAMSGNPLVLEVGSAMSALIRPAVARDLPTIETLLRSFDLTTAGVADHLEEFVVGEAAGEVVASAGLELYGVGALLRSVAVRVDYQNRGLAQTLVNQLLDRARQAGVRQVYLLTSTAEGYFRRFGFGPVHREAVDAGVRQSREFQDICCARAQAMQLILSDSPRSQAFGAKEDGDDSRR